MATKLNLDDLEQVLVDVFVEITRQRKLELARRIEVSLEQVKATKQALWGAQIHANIEGGRKETYQESAA